ncbi:Biotin carboxyl carrier protein of acetyl-CoA carboxylase [bioreactor metagenome]|uniref:Biotin carboxyl carrier protein of acetyl-CoA carboxylase n=1 Tax=bioreactor metagenome TaxID=1076179 RepID=A0A645DPM0_9ZZZZ|nr:biotin/lipoyl-containing protein [Oscillospiraceae bacterium]
MDISRLREAAEIMREFGLVKLDITDGDTHIALEKPNLTSPQPPLPLSVQTDNSQPDTMPRFENTLPRKNIYILKSPIVGTVYFSPALDKPPYVSVGSRVDVGDVVCIIEAMKMLNDITAGVGGTIVKVCVESGKLVEYNQPLFEIEIEINEDKNENE